MYRVYYRLKPLLENAGIEFNIDGISRAEIFAYSAGIAYVWNYLEKAFDDVFMANESDAVKYANLLNIDADRYSVFELKEEIRNRLAMNFATATVAEHNAAFGAIGSGNYSLILDPEDDFPMMIISGVNIEDLPQLAKFIEAYTCAFEKTIYNGNGMTFDNWDTWNQPFYALDKMALPFNIIDYLRSDMIE